MKVTILLAVVTLLAAAVGGEKLPLTQPPGYSIQTPAVPFTGEEALSQPSQQYITPDFSAAAAAPVAPVQQYITPDLSAAAAAPVAPVQQYITPDLSAAAAAPVAPVQQYITPDLSAAAAAPVAPVQQYITPDLSAAAAAPSVPAQIYQEPSVSGVAAAAAPVIPAQIYQEPAAAAAAPSQGYQQPAAGYVAPEYQAPAQYEFSYSINAYDEASNKVDFGHSEKRDGALTTGSYYVLLPDTRVMKVEYYVDDTGFHPVYTYEGEAAYPQPAVQQPSQLYTQPGRK